MLEESPRATSTTTAAVLMLVVCIPFIVNGFSLYELIVDPGSADTDLKTALILSGAPAGEPQTRTFAIFGAILTLGLCLLSFLLAAGLFRRKQSFQHAAAITFAVLAMIALGSSAAGLSANPPAENARIGLMVGLIDAAIVICLLLPSTQDDIEHAELHRARRKYEKRDAKAARKAARQT